MKEYRHHKPHNQDSIDTEEAKRNLEKNKKENEKVLFEKQLEYEKEHLPEETYLQGHTRERTWVDPVCEKEVVHPTHSCTHKETVYAFCSDECRSKFLQNPKKFI